MNSCDFYGDNRPDDWPDCGCCGGCHPPRFAGDCRDDLNRWPSDECVARLNAGTHPAQPGLPSETQGGAK